MSTSVGKIEKVLMVDDDDNIRLITGMSLEGLTDWKLSQASNGQEALDSLDKEKPDLVLLDMMMPDMDGITLFEKMKVKFAFNIPAVIFMTAKVQSQEIERYKALGAKGVIMKPFDPMTLPEQIKAILEPG